MTKLNKFLMSAAASTLLLCASSGANAAGFYIQEQSVSGLGNAFAGQSAQPRDASILFYNPAGMTYLPGGNVNVGVHVLVPDSDIENNGTTLPAGAPASTGSGGNPYDATPVPNAYITKQITDSFWLGLGISAPFGLSNEYNAGWFGRYDSTESELATIDISPSAAYKFNDWLSVGGSLIIQHASAELKNNIYTAGGTDGTQSLEGDDVSIGWKAGVLLEPLQGTRVGIDYRSRVNHDLDGRLIIEGAPGANTNISGEAGLHLPDIATFSVAHDITDRLTLLGSASWFGWNSFEDIQVRTAAGTLLAPVTQNYQTTMAYSAGFDYKASDAWTFRAGYQFDETPTTDEYRTTRTPDGDRHWFTAGTTYTMNDQWSFDLSAAYIDISEENINVTRNIAANPSQVMAKSDGYVGIVGAAVNYRF